MNIEKDFIMREVQRLVEVITVILGLKQAGKHDEALDEIDDIYNRSFGENSKTIQEKDLDGLKSLCSRAGKFYPDLAFAVADIMREEGDLLELKGERERANVKYENAMELYQYARNQKDASVPLDVMNKIAVLEEKLDDTE